MKNLRYLTMMAVLLAVAWIPIGMAQAGDATRRMGLVNQGSTLGGGEWTLWKVFDAESLSGTSAVVDSLAPDERGRQTPLGLLVGRGGFFGIWAKAAGTTPDVTIQILESFDDTAANYAVPEVNGSPLTITDTSAHVVMVEPIAMSRMRLRLKANAGNGTNTTVTLYLYTHP